MSLLTLQLLLLVSAASGRFVDDRIAGGSEAEPHSAPYIVRLQGASACGGVILSESIVLSAGHCEFAFSTVRAGEHSLSEDEGTEQAVGVSSYKIHPDYENFGGAYAIHDFALLYLSAPLTFNDYVQAASLPEAGASILGDSLALGWGRTSKQSDVLKQLEMTILEDSECEDEFEEFFEDYQASNMLCARGADSGSICFGDSGGPLLCEGDVICGLSSWLVQDCGGAYPQVFAKVSSAIDFIEENLE